MAILNFLSNLKNRVKEKNAVIHDHIALKRQSDMMIVELEKNIRDAETEEERERLVAFKQQIIDEGKRVRAEEEKKGK